MLNIQKYEEELKPFGTCFAITKDGNIKDCKNFRCESCAFHYALSGNCDIARFKWLMKEYKEPFLTEKEKGYLKNVIEPLGVEVKYIKKWKSIAIEENKCCYNIAIAVKHPIMETWERDLMNFAVTKEMPFNRLELNKKYNLEELGL